MTTYPKQMKKTVQTITAVALLALASGCATISRNPNATILGGVLGTAGGVIGFVATNNNAEGAAAGAAVGTAIGVAIGRPIDRIFWLKEKGANHASCPYCSHPVYVADFRVGSRAHCSKCGREFLVAQR